MVSDYAAGPLNIERECVAIMATMTLHLQGYQKLTLKLSKTGL